MTRIGLFLLLLVLLVGCGGSDETDETRDILASSGCEHFANVHTDLANGVLSNDEFRSKIKEVYEDLKYAETIGLSDKATALLRSINSASGDVIRGNRVLAVSVRGPLDDLVDACLEVLEAD